MYNVMYVSMRDIMYWYVYVYIQAKCLLYHPPGNEIYRKDSVSFFEIDGRKNKVGLLMHVHMYCFSDLYMHTMLILCVHYPGVCSKSLSNSKVISGPQDSLL